MHIRATAVRFRSGNPDIKLVSLEAFQGRNMAELLASELQASELLASH